MKIWLDDERPMQEPYDIHAKTAEEAIAFLGTGQVTHISLDHDLGQELTGYDVAKWIEEQAFHGNLAPLHLAVHTANPAGRKNILMALQNAERHWSYL